MENIKVKEEEQTTNGWKFLVKIGSEGNEIEYVVILDKAYWKELTSSHCTPEELVKKSFEFLLDRESKESILKEFNLRDISKYFPEYEDAIRI